MKYNVGDKVRIKPKNYFCSVDGFNNINMKDEFLNEYSRLPYCEKVMTIKFVSEDFYLLKEDAWTYKWTDEMIECKVKEGIKLKFKKGDKITSGKVTLTILALLTDRYVVEDNFGECGTLFFNTQDDWKLVEEEEIEFTEEDKFWCDIMSESDPTTYVLPQGYQFVDENGNVINATKIVLEKKEKEYPKTYKECCEVMGVNHTNDLDICEHCDYKTEITYYEDSLLEKIETLYRLRICRDAYWKIYGEETGLGKPWEPNWTSYEGYPAIYMYRYQITLSVAKDVHHCLVFPTEEMRDAFYEAFKEEIEKCKEFL